MPFEPMHTVVKQTRPLMASISYRKFDTKKGRGKPPRLLIAIPTTVSGAFAPKSNDTFEFHIGTGEDIGKARIMPGRDGVIPTHFMHAWVFRFGFVPLLGHDAADKEQVDVKMIGKDTFEIALPKWFKSGKDEPGTNE